MDDESKPSGTEEDSGELQQPRRSLLQIVLEALVPAAIMGVLWVTGNWRDEYPLSTVFVLAVISFAVTWLVGRRFGTPFPAEGLLKLFIPQLAIMAFIGHTALAWRFPELGLSPPVTGAALIFVAVLANEVRSPEGFMDFVIMLALGFVVPLIAFELGYPQGIWATFFLSVIVLLPLSVLVFNRGVDEDVGAATLAPLIGMCIAYLFGTTEPKFDIGASIGVVFVLVLVRLTINLRPGRPDWDKASGLISYFILAFLFMDVDGFKDAAVSLFTFWR